MRISDLSSDVCSSDLAYKSPVGTLTGFAYLVDQDETVVLAKSSQTYGARLAGAHPLTKAVKLSYAASYARQSDYRNNPNDYSAEYYLVEAGLGFSGFTLGGGLEDSDADTGGVTHHSHHPYRPVNTRKRVLREEGEH